MDDYNVFQNSQSFIEIMEDSVASFNKHQLTCQTKATMSNVNIINYMTI